MLTSASVGIIIILEDPRQPGKLISCLLLVDRFVSLWVLDRTVGDGGCSVGRRSPKEVEPSMPTGPTEAQSDSCPLAPAEDV